MFIYVTVTESPLLNGKVAIVTGGSSGIGKASAIALAKLGVKVAIAARCDSKIQAVVEEIKSLGGTAIGVPTDVTQRSQVKSFLLILMQLITVNHCD